MTVLRIDARRQSAMSAHGSAQWLPRLTAWTAVAFDRTRARCPESLLLHPAAGHAMVVVRLSFIGIM